MLPHTSPVRKRSHPALVHIPRKLAAVSSTMGTETKTNVLIRGREGEEKPFKRG
jgi:hypothetical protein